VTFNVGAIPFAVVAVLLSLLVGKYRLAIVKQSLFRSRTPEEQERLAQWTWLFVALAVLLSLAALFAPLWG
jgi:hypothetical protein